MGSTKEYVIEIEGKKYTVLAQGVHDAKRYAAEIHQQHGLGKGRSISEIAQYRAKVLPAR